MADCTDCTPSPDDSNYYSTQGLVLVSIPHYRSKATVRKAVESVLSQTYKNVIVVLINDGDPDPPWEELSGIRDSRLIRFELQRNEGRYFADAVVVDAIDAPYFLMQDADDWSESNRVSKLLHCLKSTNADAAISTMQKFVEIQGKLVKWDTLRFPHLSVPLTPKYRKRASHCGLFKTSLLRLVGGYYAGFRYGYDTLLVNFLCMVGDVRFVDEILYNALVRPESLSHSTETGMTSRARRRARIFFEWAYREAFRMYLRKERSEITNLQLAACIRRVRSTMVDALNEKRLQVEAERLRQQLRSSGLTHLVRDATQAQLAQEPSGLPPAFAPNNRGRQIWTDQAIVWNNWTISRDIAADLSERLLELQPKVILECGSGLSTLFLAAYAAISKAKVISLEHNPAFYRRTRSLLRRFKLARFVELQLSPIKVWRMAAREYKWYSFQQLSTCDFVLIDGHSVEADQEGSLFAIAPYLASKSEIWLIQEAALEEGNCLEFWQRHFQFELEQPLTCGRVRIFRNVRRLTQQE